MAKSALVAIFAIGVAKTLPFGLNELRRYCRAISIALQTSALPMIAICICVHEFTPVFLHALPFEVAFCCIEEEDVRLVLVSGTLTFVVRSVWLKHDGLAQLEQEESLTGDSISHTIYVEKSGVPFVQEQFNAIVSHPLHLR